MLLTSQVTPANDKEVLLDAVDGALASWATYAPDLGFFRRRVQRSRAVPPSEVPDDVITLNSRFAVRNDHTGETICYTLVLPDEEAVRHGKLSVLSPMGMALYGARVGDEVCWMHGAGRRAGNRRRDQR